MSTAVVRDALDADLDAASAVMLAAYDEYIPAGATGPWAEYRREIGDVRSRLGEATLIVAEEAGRIAGAVTYYADAGKESNAPWPTGWAVFRLLGVHPDRRGRGLGRLLVEECLRRARAGGRAAMGLHTTEFMAVARAMYERMGFARVPALDFRPVPQLLVMAYHLPLR
jgi:GNAT superfamily N-acetyltransferase